ncbi:LacI family DNA-binding transcriptional regulator [Pseudokineococcus basanitobsidens]|uniref:LacI family DNA-binding transcriptional regulator n=1 Tax=Pseudokineococcus basanitobsidens TaxID=1926649 RepID=A0ABU8RFF1_9ACTN
MDPQARQPAAAATLRDVARLAGVSVSTASKALNERPHVRASTREAVRAAADQLSFSPNSLAQGLSAQRTGTVGLLTSDLEGRFSIPVLMGAEDAFGSDRVAVLLCDARGDAIREQHHLRALLARRVDGLIVVGARPDVRPSIGRVPVPVVYAYAPSDDPGDLSLVSDNERAGAMAVEHLLASGRRRIGHVTGDPTYGAARDRAAGALAALERAGLELAGGEPFYGAWSEEWGRSAQRALLRAVPEVDAVFAGSDQVARGVLDALREAGRRVPEDVAVVGFDNWEAIATGSRPSLTTVDLQLQHLGRVAAQRLSAAMSGDARQGVERLPCRLVVRASSAPRD